MRAPFPQAAAQPVPGVRQTVNAASPLVGLGAESPKWRPSCFFAAESTPAQTSPPLCFIICILLRLMHSSPPLPDIQGRCVNNKMAGTNPPLNGNYSGSTVPSMAVQTLSHPAPHHRASSFPVHLPPNASSPPACPTNLKLN